MQIPKLRDSKRLHNHEIYPLNDIPIEVIRNIGSNFIALLYMGRLDITGDDWGDAFAASIGGVHLASPIGIADVIKDNFAWL